MNKKVILLGISISILAFGAVAQKKPNPIIENAAIQLTYALEEVAKAKTADSKAFSPRSIRNDSLFLVPSKDWTSGFFPGDLWFMYELTKDAKFLEKAKEFTALMEREKTNVGTHDMGFKMFCSYGNGYRLTKDPQYREVLLESALTLSTRFNPKVGCIKSWDNRKEWNFPVIIDNMLNLELLFWAFKETKDSSFYKIAVSHANTTMKNHFRPDFSSYHVIGYDVNTGAVIQRTTHQGYSDSSSWARGQSWGLYGFTMCYRETGNKAYLQQAENIAAYLLHHPNLPTDMVPYWDYYAPGIPNAPRDVSAATIMASALLELSTFATDEKGAEYKKAANAILKSVAEKYTAPVNTNKGFLLIHSTGHLPAKLEIDTPLIYADYYYLEALLRKRAMNRKK